jgi:hypothetical protein
MKNLGTILVILVLFVFGTSSLFAQSCENYAPVTRATGITYNSIAGSSPSYFVWRNTTLNQNDDNRSYPIPIGFDFWYLGVRYTQITGSLNGTLDFSSSTSDGNNGGTGPYGPNYNNLFSTANQTMLALAPLYADLWTANAGTTPIATSLAYKVIGSAPNRELTVEWINFDEWNTPVNVPAASVNMLVKIYETTGAIEFIYGTMTAGASGGGTYPLRYTCGINNTWTAGVPTAVQLLTQQTANTTTFNNTAQNALTTLPASNSKLTFTPPVPTAAPTGLTFTSVTQTEMTLNWADNATNEVGYVIYNSTDGTNYSFVTQVAADSVSAAITGLLSSTTYYWQVYAVTEGTLSAVLTGTQATSVAGTVTSITTGNWNATTTWDADRIPTAGDNVIIANGTTVTLDGNGSCNSLTVVQGVSGQLTIGNDTITRTLTVSNDVIVNTGATITTGAMDATHMMNVGGNLTNNGTLNLAPTGTRVCNFTFNKNGNQTISGTGSTTNFNRITLNMGTSNANELDITSTNFTVAVTNFLTLNNGTFKLSTAATVTPFTGNVTIPFSGGIWVNNAGATVSTTGGTITLYGYVRASAGTFNIGSAANNNLTSYGGTITIDGGTVNISGRLDRAGPTILTNFTMSSGTLTVATVGSTTASAAPFRIDEVGSTFNMSGGTIIVRRPGAGNLGYINTGGTVGNVSGGTLQIGDASTPAAQNIQINSSIAVPNLVVSNGVAVTAQLVINSLTVNDSVTINSGTLDANALNITLRGNWMNNGGSFMPGTGTVSFNGSAAQSISGSSTTSFNNMLMNNAAGLTINTSPTINGTLTLTEGVLNTGANQVSVTNNVAGAVVITSGSINGKIERAIAASATGTYIFNDANTYIIPYGSQGAITFAVQSFPNTDVPNDPSYYAIKRYYTITPSGSITATMRLSYNQDEVRSGQTESNFSLWRYNGTAWVDNGFLTNDPTANWVQQAGISTWSDWTISETGGPLPVQFVSFVAIPNPNGGGVKLEWTTISEINNYGFNVERRKQNDGDFVEIPNSFIPGAGSTTEPQSYSFVDNTLTESGMYEYRLHQVDNDGLVSYSQPVSISVSALSVRETAPIEFRVHQNYPNPFNPKTTIKFSVEKVEHAELVVYNSLGQEIARLFDGIAEPGYYYKVELDGTSLASGYASGVYFYRVITDSKSELKKMILIK